MHQILNELVEIEKKCAEAFNKKDLPAILGYFSADISGFSSTDHDRFQGKDELRQTFQYYLAEAETVTYEILDPSITEAGDTAILSFYWRVTLKTGKKRIEIPGRGSHVYHRQGGKWLIVHEHFSRVH